MPRKPNPPLSLVAGDSEQGEQNDRLRQIPSMEKLLSSAEMGRVIEEFGRPEYEEAIANNPKELPLGADAIVRAFEIWDRRIGGNKIQEEEG